MALLRRRRTQADELARWRGRLREDLNPPLLELLADLELPVEPLDDGWLVSLGPARIALVAVSEEAVIAGIVPLGPMAASEGMRRLLHANSEHSFGYFAGGDPGEVDGRIKVPVDPIGREAVVQGIQGLAEVVDAVGHYDMSEVLRRLRAARRGESDPSVARRHAPRRLQAGLGELGIPASARDDGIWAIETERGVVDAILADTGASWMLMHEIRWEEGDQDPDLLRWLLVASGARHARVGLADLPDGPHLFSVIVLPASAPNASTVAYGLEGVLRVADEMDRHNGYR